MPMTSHSINRMRTGAGMLLLLAGALMPAAGQASRLSFSVTPVEQVEGSTAKDDAKKQFGGAYAYAESVFSDDAVTVGGKIYYRLSSAANTDEEKQRMDIKKAYIKVRPLRNYIFECAIGKLYNYYLPGAYFSITEIYTGASRWGKSGAGMRFSYGGFTAGAALPLSETNEAFKDGWGLNGGLSYDFSELNTALPLTAGLSVCFDAAKDGSVNSHSSDDFSGTASLYYNGAFSGMLTRLGVFASWSWNASPYVTNSSFKPVASYKTADLQKAYFGSLGLRAKIGGVELTSETEAGHSNKGSLVPFFTVFQLVVPVTNLLRLKPRAGYFAAWDTKHDTKSRDAYEIYPRVQLTAGRTFFTAGWQLHYRETAADEYTWLWAVPLTLEIRL